MPSEAELPRGARRDFVQELFAYYRAAGRPTLRQLSDQILSNEERKGTASRETIRRMLRGDTVPPQWLTVEALFLALCAMAGRSPGDPHPNDDDPWAKTLSNHEYLRHLWNEALDDPGVGETPQPQYYLDDERLPF